jgi:hypothetical protein
MPVLARVYHIPPFEQHRITLAQFAEIRADYQRVRQEQDG